MEIAGYIASIIIGISLGIIGGGGSILTVPVLVYLFSVDLISATAYSLFIVGTTSVIGSIAYFKQGLVNIKTAIIFGIPSVIAVLVTRIFILPAIPTEIANFGAYILTKNLLLMLLFALLMIVASLSMIKKEPKYNDNDHQPQTYNIPLIVAEGGLVGILTGLVGAGGGFLIIPAMVILSKLPMKQAIGTSLVIIAAKSLIGFLGESSNTIIDWQFLIKITSFAIVGIFIGAAISKKIDGAKMKPVFGWFVLVMGVYIIVKETQLLKIFQ